VAEAISINCHHPSIEIYTSSSFVTDKAYKNHDDLIEWACTVAAKLRFAIVTVNSDYDADRRKPKPVLGCERDGVYKPTNK
jgi:hypothetical protein